MEILTAEGMVDVATLRTMRLFSVRDVTTTSGTITVAGFDLTKGHIFARPLNGSFGFAPSFSFNNTTKVLTWSRLIGDSTQFRFIFCLFK
jgi:hypothetical protein